MRFTLKHPIVLLSAAVVLCAALTYTDISKSSPAFSALPISGKTIILDPGHGGWDPGKTGISGENEKDINLKIALRIKDYLEQGGAEVYMTRETDTALSQTKSGDMKERINHAKKGEANVFISIHQNAFTSAAPRGAQVFYYNGSDGGRALAECIQSRLISFADSKNTRSAKQNSSYYILKKTDIAAIIIECGFLSNPAEERELNTEEYRDKIAWAVYMGLWDYFSEQST